ncbi:rifampicin phosphotransferase-like [Dermacentor albipictus]|uniref:rifampicin phosphotransferase-like n=1 Tax=Dermacentor albipictus TaxID=60249 RepID=UPI0038FCE7D6
MALLDVKGTSTYSDSISAVRTFAKGTISELALGILGSKEVKPHTLIWFPAHVGQIKGAPRNLNESFAVPRGFIITTESYKVFSSSEHFQQLMRTMETAMTRDDWQTALKGICSSMVGALERLNMPADVQEAISQRLSKFDKDTLFAVRSSALGEDSEDMSAAGQMTTLLGVRGQDNVISAVVKCWASQFSFTNVNYKRQYGQALEVPMAVVVQELVNADTAGVMFTCDPLTGNPGYITVTANYGIGESVVSASAEPDTFVLKKRGSQHPTIESSQIGHKSVYTTTSGSDAVATVSVSAEKAQRACISEEDVQILAAIGAEIEKTYTTPQDIEWALKDGIFFMLQLHAGRSTRQKGLPALWLVHPADMA